MKTTYWKSCALNLLVMSDVTLEASLKVECGTYNGVYPPYYWL